MKRGLFFAIVLSISFTVSPVFGADGKELYEKSCKTCHGLDGKGNVKVAKMMKIDPSIVDLTKKETKDKKDKELEKLISDGIGKMKGLKDKLKTDEVSLIVSHLRVLQGSK